MKRRVNRVFIHCSASDNPNHDDVKVIDRWHKNRGWSGIGYHFFINKDGTVQEGRDINKTPAAQKGHNKGTIAICLHGLNDFTEAQFKSLRALCNSLKDYIKNPITFHGHNEVSNKTCPNFDVKKVLGKKTMEVATPKINRKHFYDTIRRAWGGLSKAQVTAIGHLLDNMEKSTRVQDRRHMAYMLATVKHETANTYEPIREYGRGKGRKYGWKDPETKHAYYGRGYVQLTWRYNYKTASDKLGVDFVWHPDKVMEPKHAYDIMELGMLEGWFTGRRLNQYINDKTTDYRRARKIINGMDRANTIAGYAKIFEKALSY